MMRRDLIAVLLVATSLLLLAARAMADEPQTVDLNQATVQELRQLPGVGAKRAEAILRYRLIHPFRRTSDLMRIKGIGAKMFVRIRPLVRVDPEGAAKPVTATDPTPLLPASPEALPLPGKVPADMVRESAPKT
jgi:competence ComEA-like helix-hairpin-helix protein